MRRFLVLDPENLFISLTMSSYTDLRNILWPSSPRTAAAIAAACYLLYVRCRRYRHWYYLETLPDDDPCDATSAHEIYRATMGIEFPFLGTKALEFGLFKTYGIPSIARILVSTQELVKNGPKRYDDTDLLVREMTERAPDSTRANLAIRRMNKMHSMYPIRNDDYLYVLAVFIVEPMRWISMYGYRQPHSKEKHSSFLIWKDVGIKMGIKNTFSSYSDAETYLNDYEEKKMRFDDSNKILADASTRLFLSTLPSVFHPIGTQAVSALCDNRLRSAMGYSDPSLFIQFLTHAGLKILSLFIKYFQLPRKKLLLRTPEYPQVSSSEIPCLRPVFDPYEITYPDGYRIDELGPAKSRTLCPLYHAKE